MAWRLSLDKGVRISLSNDPLGLLRLFGEDESFGCKTFSYRGLTLPRDKLDSIMETYYLIKIFGINTLDKVNVLDIGQVMGGWHIDLLLFLITELITVLMPYRFQLF